MSVSGDTLRLSLDGAYPEATITYVPDKYYRGTSVVYEGPWVVNNRGLGAMSFDRYRVRTPGGSTGVDEEKRATDCISIIPNPASARTRVVLNNPITETVVVCLYDVLGSLILKTECDPVMGTTDIPLDLASLQQGLYWCVARRGLRTLTTRLVVRR